MDDDQFLLQVFANLDEAEVVTIFFPMLRKALVVDTRHNAQVGPLLAVVPQVGSMRERVAWVAEARPDFDRPGFILAVPWIKSIRSLGENGVFTRLRDLLLARNVPSTTAATYIRQAQGELLRVERASLIAMVRGEGYYTLWARDEG